MLDIRCELDYFDKDVVEVVVMKNFEFDYNGIVFTIERGFRSDGASVPRFFTRSFPRIDKYLGCYLLHDWLYQTQFISRKEADEFLLKQLKIHGMKRSKAFAVYSAVRCFGWRHWKQHELSNWI